MPRTNGHAALAAGCLLSLLLCACGGSPTRPTPPPAVEAPSDPPPPPPAPAPPIPIRGAYDAVLRISASCGASPVAEYFDNLPEKTRSRRYPATVSGPADDALVKLASSSLRPDPVWGYGDYIGIAQHEQRVDLRTWSGYAPDIVEELEPGASLAISIWEGTGQVVAGRVEVTWQGRVSLVDTRPPDGWRTLAACDATDHELFLLPREP